MTALCCLLLYVFGVQHVPSSACPPCPFCRAMKPGLIPRQKSTFITQCCRTTNTILGVLLPCFKSLMCLPNFCTEEDKVLCFTICRPWITVVTGCIVWLIPIAVASTLSAPQPLFVVRQLKNWELHGKDSYAAQKRILRESYYLPPDYFTRFLNIAGNLDHCLSAV